VSKAIEIANPLTNNKNLCVAKMRGVRLPKPAHQQMIKLSQRLFLAGPASQQVVVFSAVEPGNGCTFICARTAEILAADPENSVCLIDANFRSPGLHHEFEGTLKHSPEQEWALTRIRGMNLWFLSYRPSSTGGDELTAGGLDRFQTTISELRKEFTHVLIDAPPLTGCADAAILGRMADGLVMVLEANDTRRESAQKAKEMLEANGVQLLGAVLNKRTFPIPEPLYRRL
jgi:succinoglycan biosynthesis transport protein ExoP